MERYGGFFSYSGYLLLQYLLLSDRIVVTVLFIGLGATMAGLIMLTFRPAKRYIDILFIVSLLPFCLGIIGTFTTTANAWDAARLEAKNNLPSSAYRYYDYQYFFNKYTLYAFPAAVGFVSTLPPFLMSMVLKHRLRPKVRRNG